MAAAPASPSTAEDSEIVITIDDLLYILRRFWFLILLSGMLGGGLALYAAMTQPAVYERQASIILKDEKGAGNALAANPIMAELGMGANVANVANEMHVLKSSPIMRRVVEELALHTTYWEKDGLARTELYKETPLKLTLSEAKLSHPWYSPDGDARPWYIRYLIKRDRSFHITLHAENSFTLTYKNEAGETIQKDGRFGEPLQLPFAKLTLTPTPLMSEAWQGRQLIVFSASVENTTRNLLKENLQVIRPDVKEGSLLEISFRTNNALKAEETLNLLLSTYNQMSVEEKQETARNTKSFLESRLNSVNDNLKQSDRELTDYRQQHAITMDDQTTIGTDLMTSKEMEKEIFTIETQLKLAATLAEDVKNTKKDGGLIAADVELLKDSALTQQIQAYNSAFLEYRKLVASAGAKNPLVVNQRERMYSILGAIDKALVNYRNNIEIRLKEAKGQLEGMEARVEEGFVKRQEIIPLMRQHKVLEELYLLLLAKEQENALSIAAAEPRARILEQAYGEPRAVAPRKVLYLAGGVLGGCFLSFIILLSVKLMDTKAKTRQDLEPYSSIPTIAELPQLTRREMKEDIFDRGVHSIMAECLHILRNNVENLLPRQEKGGTIILMTSTVPGEGKTFVSSNLAVAYAKAGRRVLIIDGDLRKGTLSRGLIGKGLRGLSTLLLHHAANPKELIRPLPGSRDAGVVVDLLASGPLPPNPIPLLTQPLFRQTMDSLRNLYDVIILDAPPHGIIADTDILAQTADLSLYVVRSGMIDKRYFTQVQRLADQGRLPNPGYVLNDVNFRASSSGHYGYGYGNYHYHYGAEGSKTTDDITEA